MLRRSLMIVSALALWAAAAAGQDHGPEGRYDFTTVSDDGDTFTGTLYIVGGGGSYGGFIFTTIQNPLPIKAVVAADTQLTVTAALRSDIDITFDLQMGAADSFAGTWAFMDRAGPVQGRRVPTNRRNDLEPVPCRVRGTREVVRCGFRYVYEDRAAATGRMIPLRVVVLPAVTDNPAPDPLFHFAGGPGQAATAQAGGNAQRFAAIRQQRDIVMVDQRGTGGSNGMPCEFGPADRLARAVMAWDFSHADIERCLARVADRADPRFYHTAIAMDDIDEVREWLGYERINLYGGSYGTRAGLAYLRQYPDRVRTATLRGVIAPSGMLSLDNPRDAQVALNRVFDDCAAQPACASAFPDLRGEFASLLERLTATPAELEMMDPRTRQPVRITITRGLFGAGIRRFLMDANGQLTLPNVIHRAAQGDFSPFEPGIRGTLAVFESLSLGMGFSVMCSEDAPKIAARDVDGETSGTFLGPAGPRAVLRACESWPAGTPPAGYDLPVRADAPVLLLSGSVDPTTPPRWGDEVDRDLPNSLHLVMEGVSHSPFPRCALDIMTALVRSGTLEGLDTSCVADLERGRFETDNR